MKINGNGLIGRLRRINKKTHRFGVSFAVWFRYKIPLVRIHMDR